MLLLDIFQHGDGTFAWDNLLFLLIAFIAGYLLHRFSAKKSDQRKYNSAIAESESKFKKLENEFKNYKSNINSSEKQSERSVVQLSGRVKSLEGDIRVLADEKNKLHQQFLSKEEEIKRYSRQISEMEDNLKSLEETKYRNETEASEKLKSIKEELTRAAAWEKRVRAAEEEAERARAAIGNAERKKLEAELRLKATAEFAGKVGPLEMEIKSLKDQLANLDSSTKEKSNASDEILSELKMVSAQLELQKETNKTLQHEFDIKHADNISLLNEIDHLKDTMTKMAEENDGLRSRLNTIEIKSVATGGTHDSVSI